MTTTLAESDSGKRAKLTPSGIPCKFLIRLGTTVFRLKIDDALEQVPMQVSG